MGSWHQVIYWKLKTNLNWTFPVPIDDDFSENLERSHTKAYQNENKHTLYEYLKIISYILSSLIDIHL